MKIKLILRLHTEVRYGGNYRPKTMFTKTLVLERLTGGQLVNWIEHGYIQIKEWTFRPSNLSVIDSDLCICEGAASGVIFLRSDVLEYYQELSRNGWIPNTEHANEIQSDGYRNFIPEEF